MTHGYSLKESEIAKARRPVRSQPTGRVVGTSKTNAECSRRKQMAEDPTWVLGQQMHTGQTHLLTKSASNGSHSKTPYMLHTKGTFAVTGRETITLIPGKGFRSKKHWMRVLYNDEGYSSLTGPTCQEKTKNLHGPNFFLAGRIPPPPTRCF